MSRDVDTVFEAIDRWERTALIDRETASALRRETEQEGEAHGGD